MFSQFMSHLWRGMTNLHRMDNCLRYKSTLSFLLRLIDVTRFQSDIISCSIIVKFKCPLPRDLPVPENFQLMSIEFLYSYNKRIDSPSHQLKLMQRDSYIWQIWVANISDSCGCWTFSVGICLLWEKLLEVSFQPEFCRSRLSQSLSVSFDAFLWHHHHQCLEQSWAWSLGMLFHWAYL